MVVVEEVTEMMMIYKDRTIININSNSNSSSSSYHCQQEVKVVEKVVNNLLQQLK
jgi:hypothetical protein